MHLKVLKTAPDDADWRTTKSPLSESPASERNRRVKKSSKPTLETSMGYDSTKIQLQT